MVPHAFPWSRVLLTVGLIVVSVAMYASVAGMGRGIYEPLGAGALPRLLSVSVGGLACVLLLQGLRDWQRAGPLEVNTGERPQFLLAALSCMLTLGYAAVMTMGGVGFRAATFAYVLTLGLLLSRWRVRTLPALLLAAGIMSFGVHYLFTRVLVVDLP